MKPFRLIILLTAAAAAIFGAVVVFGSRIAPGPSTEVPFLSGIGERRMEQIELKGVDSKDRPFELLMVREASPNSKLGGWILGGNGSPALDRVAATQFFGALQSLRPAHLIEDADVISRPELFGLDRPDLTLAIRTNIPDHPLYTFVFGKTHQFTGRRYLRVNNDPVVYLVEEQMYAAIKKQRSDLEVRSPLRFDTSRVQLIEIDRTVQNQPQTPLRLERGSGGVWTVGGESPDPAAADSGIISDLLSALSGLQVEESITADKSTDGDYGLRDPKAVVKLRFTGDAKPNPLVLSFGEQYTQSAGDSSSGSEAKGQQAGRKIRQYYVRSGASPVVFRLKQRPMPDLFQPASYFWNRKPLSSIAPAAVGEIRITSAGRTAKISGAFPAADENPGAKPTPFQFLALRILNLEVISYDVPLNPPEPLPGADISISGLSPDGSPVLSIKVEGPIETGSAPDQASRFPPYSVLVSNLNQPGVRCIVSGAEIELFRELFKRME